MGSRVLKAHTEAVKGVLGAVDDATARAVAEAVLTALDGVKTRYVIGVRTHSGMAIIYGEYATVAAAQKAIDTGAVGVGVDDRAGIFALVPAPKVTATRRKKAG